MSQYYIKRKAFKLHEFVKYEVAKFQGDKCKAIYEVSVTPRKQSCTCPAWTMPEQKPDHCKHMLFVGRWLKDKEPEGVYYEG